MCPASDYQLPEWVRASAPPAAEPAGEREGVSGTSAPSRDREREAPGARSGGTPPDDSLAC